MLIQHMNNVEFNSFAITTFAFPLESTQVDKVRSKRGKVTRSSDFKIKNDVKQHLEAVDTEMPLDLQTNFLSESVRKYLELGRAIPGLVLKKFILESSVKSNPYELSYCPIQSRLESSKATGTKFLL